MKETQGQSKKRKQAGDAPELSFAGVEFKPAPDAQDRLRRLFTILARALEDYPPATEAEQSPEDGGWENC